MTTTTEAWEAAIREGLSYFWASRHVGGSISFVGQSWEDGGIHTDGAGTPVRDHSGNTIAKHTIEDLDPANESHQAQVETWYTGV